MGQTRKLYDPIRMSAFERIFAVATMALCPLCRRWAYLTQSLELALIARLFDVACRIPKVALSKNRKNGQTVGFTGLGS